MQNLERPLLIEGEAGIGKTSVAKALATIQQTQLIRLQCHESLDVNSAAYEWHYAKQLLWMKLHEHDNKMTEENIFSQDFLLERPLLAAIRAEHPVVLLIDEIDRADVAFEAFLLELLADFRFLNDHVAMQQVERLAEMLAYKLTPKATQKRTLRLHGSRLAVRETIRKNLKYGGNLLQPYFYEPERMPPKLLIIHDVSHSMAWNNPLLFRFIRGLMRVCHHSEVFAFHTEIFRITDCYHETSIKRMRDRLTQGNRLWLGGTCIASSLQTFDQQYAKRYLNKNSIAMILSDGCDTDEPTNLFVQLKQLKKKAKKVIWLNPMLGREHYQLNQHDKKFNQLLDAYLPAHSLDALKTVINTVQSF